MCVKKLDEAEKALNGLKQRTKRISAECRERLNYWIRTGEPRVNSRKG